MFGTRRTVPLIVPDPNQVPFEFRWTTNPFVNPSSINPDFVSVTMYLL
jgi:hypothetical protein